MSFSANWPMRGEPAPLMFPKPELFTLAVGLLRFVWLSRLKNSARNWKRARSVMGMFLNSPVSHPKNPGPRKLSLPSVPNVPIAGTVNAFGFSHFTHGVGVPQVPEAKRSEEHTSELQTL